MIGSQPATRLATMRPSASRRRLTTSMVCFGFIVLSLLVGAWGAVGGWFGQAILLLLVLPLLALIFDYRLGLILCIVILPYTNAPFLRGLGLFTVTNLLLLGTFCAILIRWVLSRMASRHLHLLLPWPVFLLYLLPILIGMFIGTQYLAEIPPHFITSQGYEVWGVREYWVSYWLKGMLFVFFAFALGGAVIEFGNGRAFIRIFLISALMFSCVVLALVLLSGASLGQLQGHRGSLGVTGRHNTEAGFLLATAIAALLFIREYQTRFAVRLFLLVMIGVFFTAMMLTFTRGAMLALAAVVLYYVWHFRRPMILVTAAIIVVMAVTAMPDAVRDRMLLGIDTASSASVGPIGGGDDKLTMGRTWIWVQLIDEIPKAPAFGRGVMSTQWSDLVKRGTYLANHPHNTYLAIVMDLGIFGLVAMFAFFIFLWRIFSQLCNNEDLTPLERGYFAGSKAMLVALLVWGFSNGQYFPVTEQIYIWTSIGLALGYYYKVRLSTPVALGRTEPSTAGTKF